MHGFPLKKKTLSTLIFSFAPSFQLFWCHPSLCALPRRKIAPPPLVSIDLDADARHHVSRCLVAAPPVASCPVLLVVAFAFLFRLCQSTLMLMSLLFHVASSLLSPLLFVVLSFLLSWGVLLCVWCSGDGRAVQAQRQPLPSRPTRHQRGTVLCCAVRSEAY